MKSLLYALLSVFSGGAALAAQASSQAKHAPASTATPSASAVSGDNAFAVDLYAQLRTQPGNLFFSPESISTAFAMAYAGASGQTAGEMASVFHFTLPPAQLHAAMGALLTSLNAKHQGYELRVADALWAQQDSSFLPAYLKVIQSDYGAALHQVNFKTSADAVRTNINQWVEKQTDDKIKDLIGPGVLKPTTRLVLTNAIYFKGDWSNPFDAASTQQDQFHISATQFVMAPLMHRTGGYRYFDGGAFQALELPYAGNDLSMVVFLPRDVDGLEAFEQSFTAEAAGSWIARLAPANKVVVTLPRFTMTQQFELSSALSAMGMPQAFTDAADFSAMTGKPGFTISAAIHKAFIDVNEKGTEAAAATSLVVTASAMRYEPPPIDFRADHPFVFLVLDKKSGSILFLGRVADPSK
jgi:serpin B